MDVKVSYAVYTLHTKSPHSQTHTGTHVACVFSADLVGLTELAGATPLFGSIICLLRAEQCITVCMCAYLHCLCPPPPIGLSDSSLTYPQVKAL